MQYQELLTNRETLIPDQIARLSKKLGLDLALATIEESQFGLHGVAVDLAQGGNNDLHCKLSNFRAAPLKDQALSLSKETSLVSESCRSSIASGSFP